MRYMLVSRNFIWIAVLALVVTGGLWGIKAGWNFWKDRPAQRYYGEETFAQRGFVPLGQWEKRETKHREKSSGDITIIEGARIISDTEFLHSGSIAVEGEARLTLQNSVLEMTPGNAPALPAGRPRANIFVRDRAELIFENSTLKPHADDPANLYVYLDGEAKFIFNNSSGIHMLIAGGNSKVQIYNSTWAYSQPKFRGGGVKISGSAIADIRDSIIGGLVIELPKQAHAEIVDFKPGVFEKLDFQRDYGFENIGFNILLENTEILSDYLDGGSARGLAVFAQTDIANLKIVNSELNKFVLESSGEELKFSNLELERAQDFSYNNISIKNAAIMAQWGFFMHGGRGEFIDSEGLWFFVYDDAAIFLKNSVMNEFDSRDFSGVIDFTDSIWKNAGEITGDNDFVWRGSWSAEGFEGGSFRPLIWDNSRVTREFPIDIFILNPGPVSARGAAISVFDKNDNVLSKHFTDKDGRAYFSISFSDRNYQDQFYIKVSKFDKEARHEINFLTPTPIKLILK